MLTPAEPESHIQRSIFILPGSSSFVNATRMPELRSAASAGNAVLTSSISRPLTRASKRVPDQKSALVCCYCLCTQPRSNLDFEQFELNMKHRFAESLVLD